MAGLFTLRVFYRNLLLRGKRRKNIVFFFIFCFDSRPDTLPYLLYYSDYIFGNIYANQSNRFIKKVHYNNTQFEIYERTNIIRQPFEYAALLKSKITRNCLEKLNRLDELGNVCIKIDHKHIYSPITIVIDCNGLSLLIFEEKWANYASGPKSAPNQ